MVIEKNRHLPKTSKSHFQYKQMLYKMLTVFPDPVWAHAIKSRPASIIGMLYFCTGVSLEYPALAMFLFKV